MIKYRSFRNADPPHLLSVWREQPTVRGLMQPISNILFEMFVLSKPYFDRRGLIVAEDDGRVVGFVHAGFGPDESRNHVSYETGVTCVLVVRDHPQRQEIMTGLIQHSEGYLRDAGAKDLRIGGNFPLCPFYLGLCGGSDLPGVLSSDVEMDQFYREHDYQVHQRCQVFERGLMRFRAPVDRQQMLHRRKYRLVPKINPTDISWWDACVFGPTDRIRFELQTKTDEQRCGEVTFWDMGPLATRPNSGGMGMINVQIDEPHRGQGLGTFLLSESIRQLQTSGISRVEAQTTHDNEAILKILKKLGFDAVREGILYIK